MMSMLFAVVLAGASATESDPFLPCNEGYRQVQSKLYSQAIEPLESCIGLPEVKADGKMDAMARYLYIVALYASGRYGDAGQELDAINFSRRFKVSPEQAAYVDRLRASLARPAPSIETTTTKIQPTLSSDPETSKDRLKRKADEEAEHKKPSGKANSQESLNLAIEQAAAANAGNGPEGMRKTVTAIDPPYGLRTGASAVPTADAPAFEWKVEGAQQ
jgi:hypothetical protein